MGTLSLFYPGPLECSSHFVPQLITNSKICCNAMVSLLLLAKETGLPGRTLEALRNALSKKYNSTLITGLGPETIVVDTEFGVWVAAAIVLPSLALSCPRKRGGWQTK